PGNLEVCPTSGHFCYRLFLSAVLPDCVRSKEGSVSTDSDSSTTWLTQAAYDRLRAELDELIANRPVLAAEINARREEGDLRENGGYHAAKEEQGRQEARIRVLEDLLRHARVGEPPADGT